MPFCVTAILNHLPDERREETAYCSGLPEYAELADNKAAMAKTIIFPVFPISGCKDRNVNNQYLFAWHKYHIVYSILFTAC